MAIYFWLFPDSLELNVEGTITNPSPTPIEKGETTNDATKISWSPGGYSCDSGYEYILTGTLPSTVPANGGITKVEIFARMWRSSVGSDNWCLWSDSRAQNEDPFSALAVNYNHAGTFPNAFANYYLPATHNYFGYTSKAGNRMGSENWSVHGSTPSSSKVEKWQWNVTSKRTWTDAALEDLEIRMSNKGTFLGFDSIYHTYAGHARFAPAATTPRWNISQFGVRVEALDPPIPYASDGFFMGDD